MSFYTSTDALYSTLHATFIRIEKGSPDHLDGLKGLMASRLVIRLKCTEPDAEITLNGRERPFKAIYGSPAPTLASKRPPTLRADLTVELAGDTLHLVLLDVLSIKKAVADGQIRVHGPVWKLKVLIDLIKGARSYYPDVLREQSRSRDA